MKRCTPETKWPLCSKLAQEQYLGLLSAAFCTECQKSAEFSFPRNQCRHISRVPIISPAWERRGEFLKKENAHAL